MAFDNRKGLTVLDATHAAGAAGIATSDLQRDEDSANGSSPAAGDPAATVESTPEAAGRVESLTLRPRDLVARGVVIAFEGVSDL